MTPIEFVSTFLVRPFCLAVRLFANLLAGHILLVTFAVLTAAALGQPSGTPSSCRCRSCMLVVPDRLRAAGGVPAGLHLHDPHRRVHRRCHAPRALGKENPAMLHLLADASTPSRTERVRRRPRRRRRPPASPTACAAIGPGIGIGYRRGQRRSRPWPASPRPPAWSARRCSSASPSPRRSPSSASSSSSSSVCRGRDAHPSAARRGCSSPWPPSSPCPAAVGAGGARREPSRPRGRGVHPHPRGGRHRRRVPGGAEPDPPGDRTRSSGARSAFLIILGVLWKFGLPGRDARRMEDAHRAHPRRASTRPRRPRPRPRRSWPTTSASWPTPAARPARIIEEARQQADAVRARPHASGPRPRRRDCAAQRRAARGRARPGCWPSCGARWPSLAVELAEKVVEPNLDREANRRLVESYIRPERVGHDGERS